MKRIIATLLLLTLALTLTACAALSPAAPRKTFARGTWDGNTFASEFAELTLTLPESGWTISTDEEIADQIADGPRAADVFDYEVGETSRTTLCGNEYLLLTATYGNTTDGLRALFHD